MAIPAIRRRSRLVAVVTAVAALAMCTTASAETIPWEGTWDGQGSTGGTFGVFRVAPASGEWPWIGSFDGGGSIMAGTSADGSTLWGRFTQTSNSPHSGEFSITIVGRTLGRPHFEGTWWSGGDQGNWRGNCVAGPCNGDPSTGSTPTSSPTSCPTQSSSGRGTKRSSKKHRKKRKKHKHHAHSAQADVCQDLWSAPVWEVDNPRFDHLSLTLDQATLQLTGTYSGGGTLTGTVDKSIVGGVATGTFTDSTGSGTFVFKLDSTETFTGTTTPEDGVERTINAHKPAQ